MFNPLYYALLEPQAAKEKFLEDQLHLARLQSRAERVDVIARLVNYSLQGIARWANTTWHLRQTHMAQSSVGDVSPQQR